MLFALLGFFYIAGFFTALAGKKRREGFSGDGRHSDFDPYRLLHDLRAILFSLRLRTSSASDKVSRAESDDSPLTRAQVQEIFEVGSWQHAAFEEFKSTLLARERNANTFPCVYATRGLRDNDHRYIFLDSDNPAEPRNIRRLGPAMRSYLREAHCLGPNTSLVIFCGPSDEIGTVREYNERFWNFLRGLRIFDIKAWPKDIPSLTTDEKWTFCFDGEPIFPIALTPAHVKRRSRYATNLLIAMQPKWVIDNLMSTAEKRQSATDTVRGLLKKYDDIDISPDLTDYGAPGTTESRQLTLLDENSTSACPWNDINI